MNSLSSGDASNSSLWCVFLTKSGTWRRHGESWRAARTAASSEKCFPSHHTVRRPSGAGLRSHAVPGGIQPWPQAAYFLWVGNNSLSKKIQVGSRSLGVCHALGGCDVCVGCVVSVMSGFASFFFSRPCWRLFPLSHPGLSLRAHGKKRLKPGDSKEQGGCTGPPCSSTLSHRLLWTLWPSAAAS